MSGSILFCDGFDHYNNATDIATVYPNFSFNGLVAGRIDGYALSISSYSGLFVYQNFAPQTDLTVGIAVNPVAPTGAVPKFYFEDISTGDVLCSVDLSTPNLVTVICAAGTFTTNVPIIPQGNWTQLQIRLIVSASTGSVEVVFNGTNVVFQKTNINTTAGSGSVTACNKFVFVAGGDTAHGSCYYDDFILATGGFPGDCRIQTDFPVSNHAVQFAPLANTNWQEVSEVAMDGDTSYNSSSTPGQQDTFAFTSLSVPSGSSILSVSLVNASRKTDAGARTIENVVLSGSASATGANFGPSTSYQYQFDQFLTDPNTSAAWTQTGINAAFFGYKVQS